MMKRRLAFSALVLCLVLGLAACGGSSKPEESKAFSTDLTAFYETIFTDPQNSPAMMELPEDMMGDMYPGLAEVERVQTVIYTPMISAVACEVAMVEVANADDVETVKTIFQTRIDDQVAGGAWYPETIAQWEENSEIVVRDNYVCLFVVPDDLGNPAEAFNAL